MPVKRVTGIEIRDGAPVASAQAKPKVDLNSLPGRLVAEDLKPADVVPIEDAAKKTTFDDLERHFGALMPVKDVVMHSALRFAQKTEERIGKGWPAAKCFMTPAGGVLVVLGNQFTFIGAANVKFAPINYAG